MRKALTVLGLVAIGVAVTLQAENGAYESVGEITIGGEGGWDHLSVDDAAKRLYVSHATKAVVVDLTTKSVVGDMADTPGIHRAIVTIPGRIVTSNGRGNDVSIVDARALKTITMVPTGQNPDFPMFGLNGR
jgi:hypothetical protein